MSRSAACFDVLLDSAPDSKAILNTPSEHRVKRMKAFTTGEGRSSEAGGVGPGLAQARRISARSASATP